MKTWNIVSEGSTHSDNLFYRYVVVDCPPQCRMITIENVRTGKLKFKLKKFKYIRMLIFYSLKVPYSIQISNKDIQIEELVKIDYNTLKFFNRLYVFTSKTPFKSLKEPVRILPLPNIDPISGKVCFGMISRVYRNNLDLDDMINNVINCFWGSYFTSSYTIFLLTYCYYLFRGTVSLNNIILKD